MTLGPVSFEYVKLHSAAEALAGGRSLIPDVRSRLARPGALIDIGGVAELNTLRAEHPQRRGRLADLIPASTQMALRPIVSPRTLPPLHAAWRGVRIGASLQLFLQGHGDRLLHPHSVEVIVSGALEVGDTGPLARAARELARRSAALVWLNPLAGSPRFQPT